MAKQKYPILIPPAYDRMNELLAAVSNRDPGWWDCAFGRVTFDRKTARFHQRTQRFTIGRRVAATEVREGPEAFERLAARDLAPFDLLDPGRTRWGVPYRHVLCGERNHILCRECKGNGWTALDETPEPDLHTLLHVLAFAERATAEALVPEICHDLREYGVPSPTAVQWRLSPPWAPFLGSSSVWTDGPRANETRVFANGEIWHAVYTAPRNRSAKTDLTRVRVSAPLEALLALRVRLDRISHLGVVHLVLPSVWEITP